MRVIVSSVRTNQARCVKLLIYSTRTAFQKVVNNHWTGLDSSGLDWKRSSATQTPNSIGLGWKKSSKNKYNFVALSLQKHEVYVEQPPTVVGVTSKSPGRHDWKRSSATQTTTALDWVGKGRQNKCNFVVLSL